MSQKTKLSFLDRRAVVPNRAFIGGAPTPAPATGVPPFVIAARPLTFSVGVPAASGAGLYIADLPVVPPVVPVVVPPVAPVVVPPVAPVVVPPVAPVVPDPNIPDLDNVQGDVYFMFPKKWERFLFFTITNVGQFRAALAVYAPQITSSRTTALNIIAINDLGGGHADIPSTGIAFSRAGMNRLGRNEALRDPHFDNGSQFLEKTALGDRGQYDPIFDGSARSHGVITITTRAQNTCEAKMNEIIAIFGNSIAGFNRAEPYWYEGRVRPGDGEHFGWRDGISQPAIDCEWDEPKPGQRVVKPGVIIMGYPGDPVLDDQMQLARPTFTKNGTFMVFRKLEQNVLFLEDYIANNWASIPAQPAPGVNLNNNQRRLLFGARLVGRFKSGVPLALSPYIEDPVHLQPQHINNFDYTGTGGRCPLSAHIRKTEPRNLLPVVSKEYLDASVIIRAGIPYGPEITADERTAWAALDGPAKENLVCPRGLLFACYQSSIDNGFYRQTTKFANNDYFPLDDSLVPKKIGQDPIIGGPQPRQQSTGQTNIAGEGLVTLQVTNANNVNFEVSGVAKQVGAGFAGAVQEKFFATSRGGEYYFVPSIATVTAWANAN